MKRRGLVLLALVAGIGLVVAGITAPATPRRAPALVRAAPAVRHVPSVQASPSTCYVSGQTCSIHPCVEFVAATPARRPGRPRAVQPRRPICDRYPSTKIEAVPARP